MSEIKLPVRYDHSSSLLIEADGGPIADCLTNHEVGEQIAAALNATLTEQLAEAKANTCPDSATLEVALEALRWVRDMPEKQTDYDTADSLRDIAREALAKIGDTTHVDDGGEIQET